MAGNKRLNATITIGGAITGSLKIALGSTKDGLLQIGSAIRDVDQRQKLLGKSIQTFCRMGKDVSALRSEYGQLASQADRLRAAQSRLLAVEKARAHNREAMEALVGKLPGGHMLGTVVSGAGVVGALHAFEKINDAETDLRSAMLDKNGNVPEQFEQIRQEAIKLHSILPGTLADFHNIAMALKENGVSAEMIAGGALEASAKLGVVLKMPVEHAAEMTAKLREAFQLSEAELGKMADLSQRAKFGFGLGSDDLLLGAKYYGGKLGSLGLSGADSVRQIYALQGIAAQNGIDGSTFGTNFGQMLSRLATLNLRVNRKSALMKNVREILGGAGIKLDFFAANGKFSGIDNMVAQLSKLSVLPQEKRLQVLQSLFGEEGMRPAELIGRKGVGGYDAALKSIDDQASVEQRTDVLTGSFSNKIKSLTGSLETLVGICIQPLGKALIPIMDSINHLISDSLIPWVETHQRLLGRIELVVGGLITFRAATLALRVAVLLLKGGMLSVMGRVTQLGIGLEGLTAKAPLAAASIDTVGAAASANAAKLIRMRSAMSALLGATLALDAIDQLRKDADAEQDMSADERKAYEAKVGAGRAQAFGSGAFGWLAGNDVDWNAPLNWGALIGGKGSFFPKLTDGTGAKPSVPATLPAIPGPVSAPVAPTQNDNRNITINVTQQPGQSGKDLAGDIAQQIQQRGAVSQRGTLYDPPSEDR